MQPQTAHSRNNCRGQTGHEPFRRGVLTEALLKISAGYPSGGPFLVPPRKGERKRLKGGAERFAPANQADIIKERLPPAIVKLDSLRDAPPSLRILPARFSFRKAGFRRFLRKNPRIQLIPCQCAHWRGIEDHFGFWKRLPVAITCYRFLAFSRNAPWRSPTQWVCQITQFHSAQIDAFSAPEVP